MSGSTTSRRTRSGRARPRSSIASAPVAAVRTVKSSSRRFSLRNSTMRGSSSTTSTVDPAMVLWLLGVGIRLSLRPPRSCALNVYDEIANVKLCNSNCCISVSRIVRLRYPGARKRLPRTGDPSLPASPVNHWRIPGSRRHSASRSPHLDFARMEAGGQRPVATRGHVTVIEDEASISDPLRSALEREGYAVSVEPTGNGGLESVRRGEPDIVLLDLNLPDLDGRDVCRAIRQTSDVPIIMLTARGLETDRVVGLELGADDYLVKPFSMAELIARIRAVMRRTGDRTTPAPASTPTAVEVGDVAIDPATHVATHAGRTLDLPRREFDLLHMLMAHAG